MDKLGTNSRIFGYNFVNNKKEKNFLKKDLFIFLQYLIIICIVPQIGFE
jgi:hypothetical protein